MKLVALVATLLAIWLAVSGVARSADAAAATPGSPLGADVGAGPSATPTPTWSGATGPTVTASTPSASATGTAGATPATASPTPTVTPPLTASPTPTASRTPTVGFGGGGGGGVVRTAVPPNPTTGATTGAYLDWGIKESFRLYVRGPIAQGAIILSGGATENANGTFRFPGGAYGSGDALPFAGTVRFTGHDGDLDMTISNIRLRLSDTSGVIVVDVRTRSEDAGGQFLSYSSLEFASLSLAGGTSQTDGRFTTWTGVPTRLTPAGVTVFGNYYQAGQALDPASFKLPASVVTGGGAVGGTPSPTPTATLAGAIADQPTAVSVTPTATPSGGSGYLTWGVKKSFREYVTGPIAHGAVHTSGGATQNGDGTFSFPAAPGSSAASARFAGSVRFTGHDGELDMTISNLRIQLAGDTGVLRADVVARSESAGGQPVTYANVELASLKLSGLSPTPSGSRVTWTRVPAVLAEEGVQVFGGNYQAGIVLDPVSFTVPGQGSVVGFLQWDARKAFQGLASGPIAVSGGAQENRDGTHQFAVAADAGGTGVAAFGGTLSFRAHGDQFDLTLSNLRIQMSGDGAVLRADIVSRKVSGGQPASYQNVELATLNMASVSPAQAAGTTSWTGVPATLTVAAATIFGDAAKAGTVLSPLSFTLPMQARPGFLDWGVARPLRDYIAGPLARGTTTLTGGVIQNADGSFRFPASESTASSASFDGTVRFSGHNGQLEIAISNLRMQLAGTTGTLFADVTTKSPAGGPMLSSFPNVEIATLNVFGLTPAQSGGSLSFSNVPATLTEAGAPAFAQVLQPGQALDRLSFTVTPSASQPTGLAWRISQHVWANPALAGAQATTAPARRDPERGFVFPIGRATYDRSTGAVTIDFLGSVTLGNPDQGGSRISLANPSIVVDDGGAGRLLASVTYCLDAGACQETWAGPFRVTVATFQIDRSAIADTGSRVSWTVSPSFRPTDASAEVGAVQFPQAFLNSLDPSLRDHFRDTARDGGSSPKAPAPISVSFSVTSATLADSSGQETGSLFGSLSWGVKESFRNYVSGPIARGAVEVSNGALQNRDGSFRFPATGPASPAAASFGGTVHFTGHEGAIDLTISNPRIVLNGQTGTLHADVKAGNRAAVGIEFATLDLSTVSPTESRGLSSWSNVPATLTAVGAEAFGGSYRPGQALDPLSFAIAREGGTGK